jgi:hypothetical protein
LFLGTTTESYDDVIDVFDGIDSGIRRLLDGFFGHILILPRPVL